MLMRAVTGAAAGMHLKLHPGRVEPDKGGVPVEESAAGQSGPLAPPAGFERSDLSPASDSKNYIQLY